ncbi:efflux transporter periplasmic adaptor subunit [Aliifodinibius salipaludis]|uniref:Efflux transporter periplasmic adaptor subunit n=1 Tax=Fodinibius salipaludis TaxID=2032627 RepID=A0A2A2GE28_9BACT|nr:efflux RND transporter periplasmic adaptor subunit [Aliifodinibius salipaludis]PAU95244.1 efflux transporter periplasmic adaptor subunit [Aliifodinibius salipaludis]
MATENDSRISSEGMDKKIEKSSWGKKQLGMIITGVVILSAFVYSFGFMDARSSLNVDRATINISAVQQEPFQEFIQVTGTVQPIQTMYLDAVEGGVVDDIYEEFGAMVEQGDTIVVLSNSDLRLNVLQQTSAIYDQINQTRNSRLNIEQNTLSLKERLAQAENQLEITKSNFEREKKLYEQNLIAEQQFLETQENYDYQQKRYDLIYESFKQDSIKSSQQLRQIDQSLERMWTSLEAVQNILDRLVVMAPISGQLSTIELNPGQSISSSERIGQVDILDNYKVRVQIDEYHLSRVTTGLKGTFDYNGNTHQLEITKVYPVVENGQFKVDMEFTEQVPGDLTRGQTLRIQLMLGESGSTLVLDRGGFYQKTGGNWVYKITEDGDKAVRHDIRLGRQNPNYFEVLSGLDEGDRVITSNYGSFGENEVLNLE